MGTILKEIEVAGDKGKTSLRVLFDTGASRSFIRRDKAESIATFLKSPIPLRFRLGDGKETLSVEFSTDLYFTLKGYTFFYQFFIADDLAHEMILGADAMQVNKIVPIPELEDVRIDPTVLDLELV